MPRRHALTTRIDALRRRTARRLVAMLLGPSPQPSTAALPAAGIHRVLVCHTSHSLGNTLLLTPLLQELERIYPAAEIDILTRSPVAPDIYGHYFGVRRLLRMPAHAVGHPWQALRALHRMRAVRYDLAIDPDPQSQTSRLLLRIARATWKLGFEGPRKQGHVTHAVPVPRELPSTGQRPVHMLRQAAGRGDGDFPPPDIRLDASEKSQGSLALERLMMAHGEPRKRRVVGIFANATGPKLLSAGWWQAFMQVLDAAPGDCQWLEIVPASGQSMLGTRYPAYYSSDLRKLASVLAGLDTLVTLDCGVMHLACAAQVPTVGIFTVTNASEWGPYGRRDAIVHALDRPPAQVAEDVLAALNPAAYVACPAPGPQAAAPALHATIDRPATIG